MLNPFVYLLTFSPYIALPSLTFTFAARFRAQLDECYLFIFGLVFDMSCDFLLFIHDTAMNE